MSRMVREDLASGLRERLWFAETMAKRLRGGLAADVPRGELLALRGAVFFHLYSALVGLARHAAKLRNVPGVDDLLGLAEIARAIAAAESGGAEVELIERVRRDPSHIVHWLERQVLLACGAAGMARRPLPRDEGGLGLAVEDPFEPLASGDLERIDQAVVAVRTLLAEAATHLEEW